MFAVILVVVVVFLYLENKRINKAILTIVDDINSNRVAMTNFINGLEERIQNLEKKTTHLS